METRLEYINKIYNSVSERFRYFAWLVNREINYYRVKPSEVLLFLTYRCSSRCRMCTMWKRPKDYEEMTLEDWKRVVDDVLKPNIKFVYLFGGDVLLRKDVLIPLAKYITTRYPKIFCDVTTNGNLLNKELSHQLVHSGVNNVGVSIDAIGAEHDNIRRVKGMFERATQGIKDMLEARGSSSKPSISIFCTVSKLNINTFDKVFPYALDLGVDQLHIEYIGQMDKENIQNSSINGIVPNPYHERQDGVLYLNEEEARYLKMRVDELQKLAQGKIYLHTEHIECLSNSDLINGMSQYKRCYMARYHVNIDPSGNVIPCLFFENYVLGNIKDSSIDKIWNNEKHKIFLREIDDKQPPICKNCILGVQRNKTFYQALKRIFMNGLRKVYRKAQRKFIKTKSYDTCRSCR